MSSEQLKEDLNDWLEDNYHDNGDIDVEDALDKWKRVSKKKNEQGEDVRIFENTVLNKKVMTIDDEIKGFLANSEYVFHIEKDNDSVLWIAVSDYEYFKKTGFQSSWHLGQLLAFPEDMSEEQEGIFTYQDDAKIVRQKLLSMGFVEDLNFSNFMSSPNTAQSKLII